MIIKYLKAAIVLYKMIVEHHRRNLKREIWSQEILPIGSDMIMNYKGTEKKFELNFSVMLLQTFNKIHRQDIYISQIGMRQSNTQENTYS